jgi:hypothetical protein
MCGKNVEYLERGSGMLLVQAKAHSSYNDQSKSDDNVKLFSASTGQFTRFTKRYNLHNIKMTDEAASADTVAVTVYAG